MPTQEDRVLARFKQMVAYIKFHKQLNLKQLDAWAYMTLGLRPRTTGKYLESITTNMPNVKYDAKTKLITYSEPDDQQTAS